MSSEVRFAEHLNVLLRAVIRDMSAFRKCGLLLTALMYDITNIFTSLQKKID